MLGSGPGFGFNPNNPANLAQLIAQIAAQGVSIFPRLHTADRPANPESGFSYFDIDLGYALQFQNNAYVGYANT